ncbi:cell wall / vacuolar inhibitor of fructosidase 1 [Arachis duranensis]|uniref:Pectinesterase inhibitor domain-containing protein n=2 Tax=Arachis TaxID=3817 RepID=A0A444WP91_ARAHY|nr:cell wall / vacuolar inhibitor of fructosidase 1 [Arachis duranensis]XP_025692101.1 cell wall / vacuolar inhibitor of fructosidase 1 [Arachis hypogaea]QHO37774.1 Cell wall / vacuolar inhibitor of fructosidase [Arachis hypogaea]RYQ79336.1 hypothetical protein Ahy_Scaffold6g108063 [Arachis hypogaea]
MAKNLNHPSLIFTILVLITMPIGQCMVFHSNDETLIQSTCNQTIYPNLCVQILNSYPSSRNADLRGLALNMVDFMKSRSIVAVNKIHRLQQGATGRFKGALDSCIGHYNDGILKGDVPEAISGIQFNNPKFAENAVADAANEAYLCEQEFNGNSPLNNENKAVRDGANMARVIVRMLY